MTTAIHRAARHALPDDQSAAAQVARLVRAGRCRQIVLGQPFAPEKERQALKVMDKALKVGEHRATCLQATREAREAGLCGKRPRLAPQERETTTEGVNCGH